MIPPTQVPVILNPKAGTAARPHAREISELFRSVGLEARITLVKREAAQAAALAVQQGSKLVVAAGGGLDAPLGAHFSIRLVQAEYLLTRFERLAGSVGSQNDVRLSAGLVFHLAGRQSF